MATSMQTDPDEVIQVREAQKRGELRGARVSTIEYRFAPDPEVTTSQQARAKVDETVAAVALVREEALCVAPFRGPADR